MRWIGSQLEADPAVATALADRSVDDFRRLGIASGLAHALEGRALIALRANALDTARDDRSEAVGIVSRAGNAGCTAHCVESVAAVAAGCGRLDQAHELVDLASARRDATGHGMRVWERAGHERVMQALNGHVLDRTSAPAHPDVVAAARRAIAVLDDVPR